MFVKHAFFWMKVKLSKQATLDLSGATVGFLLDTEQDWPASGNLKIDGLTYIGFGASPGYASGDANTRLRWLALQPPGYHPQPYSQLAKFLRQSGDDTGATKVLIASGDERYSQYRIGGRFLGWFLKVTIGYGHRPLLALLWSLLVVLVGWIVIRTAFAAGVMRRTYPENDPPFPSVDNYERLYPLVFSLDVFLPFVNLYQEHYWWPNSACTGEITFGGKRLRVPGRWVLYYLWLQIIAGWLLSAIFVAGVTGLIRND